MINKTTLITSFFILIFLLLLSQNIERFYLFLGLGLIIIWSLLGKKIISHGIRNSQYDEFDMLFFRLVLAYILYRNIPTVAVNTLTSPISIISLVPFLKDVIILPVTQFLLRKIYIISLFPFILNIKPNFFTAVITSIFILLASAEMSYGVIGNSSYLLAQIMVMLCLFNCLKIKKEASSFFFVIYITVSLYYLLPFIAKLHNSQPLFGWINNNSLRLWILSKVYESYSHEGKLHFNQLQLLFLSIPNFAFFSSLTAILIEASGSLLFLVNKYLKILILLGLIGLHLGIMFLMDIYFEENIILLAGLLFIEVKNGTIQFYNKRSSKNEEHGIAQ